VISDWKIRQVVFGQVLDELTALFAARGFSFMPIKGAYLIMSGIAASIPQRRIRDIDLLLPPGRFDEICEWFETLKNVSPAENYWDFERSFIYKTGGADVYLELHRQINFPARFLLPAEDLFSRGVSVNTSVIFPDPADALLIHICHMLPHVVDGFSIQALEEIERYVSPDAFSWHLFWERAESTGVSGFIRLIIATCRRHTINSHTITLPAIRSPYAGILLHFDLFATIKNRMARKLLFELPFVRNPWWLLRYKTTRRIRHS